jgi:hypothetical protein
VTYSTKPKDIKALAKTFESMQQHEEATRVAHSYALWREHLDCASDDLYHASHSFSTDIEFMLQQCSKPWLEDLRTSQRDESAFHDNSLFFTGEAYTIPLPYLGSGCDVAVRRSKQLSEFLNGEIADAKDWTDHVDVTIDRMMTNSQVAGNVGYDRMVQAREREDSGNMYLFYE